MHKQFIEPSRKYADLIIPNYGGLEVAINVLLTVIEKKLGKDHAPRF